MTRRLPVYILADCSTSMQGDPIEAVKQGLRQVHNNLMDDPAAVDVACLSVITFDSSARQVVPLTDIDKFTPPDVVANGSTALGGALKVLMDCLGREVRLNGPDVKGDWRPLVFILTDGEPTDSWQSQADQLKKGKPLPANIIAVACGAGADTSVLKQITDTVLILKDMSMDGFKKFFNFMTQTISQTSAKVGSDPSGASGGVTLPPPPPQIITIMP